jgi:hypothetical protein
MIPHPEDKWKAVNDRLADRVIRVIETLADAVERVLMFLGCVLLHAFVHWDMEAFAPTAIGKDGLVRTFVDDIVYGAFLVAYGALLYEFIAVFVPFLRPIWGRKT